MRNDKVLEITDLVKDSKKAEDIVLHSGPTGEGQDARWKTGDGRWTAQRRKDSEVDNLEHTTLGSAEQAMFAVDRE